MCSASRQYSVADTHQLIRTEAIQQNRFDGSLKFHSSLGAPKRSEDHNGIILVKLKNKNKLQTDLWDCNICFMQL